MKDFDKWFHMKPPTAKTVREIRLESLLRETIPYLQREELGTRTSIVLRALIEEIKIATGEE